MKEFFAFRHLNPDVAVLELTELRASNKFIVDVDHFNKPGFHIRANAHDYGFDTYLQIRNSILQVLQISNYPKDKYPKEEFDKKLILSWPDIFRRLTPYDAAFGNMWSFLTLRILYDISLLRFPDNADERYLGKPRNVFWRLHQRVELFGQELAANLLEDESVQILERTELLGSNKSVAIALAKAIVRLRESGENKSNLAEGVREAVKELPRNLAVVSHSAMPQDEIQNMVDTILEKVLGRA